MSFVLAFLLLVAPGLEPSPRGQPRSLELVWVDVAGSVSFAFEGASAEVASLLGPAGVRTPCLVATPGKGGPIDSGRSLLVVVLGSEARGSHGAGRRVMGSTFRREEPASAVWAYFPVIASTLGLGSRPPFWSGWDREDFARALGRVVAHEIVHALAPELPHQGKGLMAARLGRSVLTAHGVRLDPEVGSALRAGLDRRAALATQDDVPVAALAE